MTKNKLTKRVLNQIHICQIQCHGDTFINFKPQGIKMDIKNKTEK